MLIATRVNAKRLCKTQAADHFQRTLAQLRDTLRKADRKARFSRFVDLPAELRNRIYEFALVDVFDYNEGRRVRPPTPAISFVNHQLRDETLPLFFRGICQNIIVCGPRTGPRRLRNELCKEYNHYFKYAKRVGWLQHMRYFHFRLEGYALDFDGRPKEWNARYYVDFSPNMESVETWSEVKGKEDREGRLSKIQHGIAKIVDGGNTTMTAKHFDAMIKFFLTTTNLRCAE